MRVEVYWNLHLNCWSVRSLEGPYKGRVVSHPIAVRLRNVKFVVQPAGRAKVIEEKKKNVHAFVRGTLDDLILDETHHFLPHPDSREAYYNPYKTETFVDRETGGALKTADVAILQNKKVYYR